VYLWHINFCLALVLLEPHKHLFAPISPLFSVAHKLFCLYSLDFRHINFFLGVLGSLSNLRLALGLIR